MFYLLTLLSRYSYLDHTYKHYKKWNFDRDDTLGMSFSQFFQV